MKHTSTRTLARPAILAAVAACCLSPSTAVSAAPAAASTPTAASHCGAGELCLWENTRYRGTRHTYDLSGTDIESCTALPPGVTANALANHTGRPVTAYQSAECAETGEFDTYPGSGTLTPQTPYRVRAFKIWEN
ncbi:hypothetical protein DSC45_14230 [Streptomyces sp. YIM 130001]|uniref:peptidase inhibitor family I36 protein n=1 Tax=Streptomyces sp. YIM 130001 TaxID=2259644 RepID=UPI000E647A04|nr:peptidase inhibitor family I36 protein [Streptomyces sp. YIM 130001]RII17316.1 hypothetical protein DSC45_14230 [Streptomyces sp. YIM 130001]